LCGDEPLEIPYKFEGPLPAFWNPVDRSTVR
jgi:hypothetical protein